MFFSTHWINPLNPVLNYILKRQQNKSLLISIDYNKQANMWFGLISSGDTIGHTQECKWKHKGKGETGTIQDWLSAVLGGTVKDDNHELRPGFLCFINEDFDSFVRHTRIVIHIEPDSCLNYSTSLSSRRVTRAPRDLNECPVLRQLLNCMGWFYFI